MYKNPRYINDQSGIALDYTAQPGSIYADPGSELHARAAAGEFGSVAPYVSEPPPHKTQFSVLEFRDRFTLAEQIAIRQAQLTDMEVGLVYDAFISADYIDVTDPRVGQGIDLYITKGLLDSDRKHALLATEPIE